MARIKIRTQFLSLFMIVGLIPLFVIGALFFLQSSKILMENSFENITAIHEIRNEALVDDLKQKVLEFESLLVSDVISNSISMINSGATSLEIEDRYSEYFSNFLTINNFYNVFILSEFNGDILFNYKNERGAYRSSGLMRVWEKSFSSSEIVMEDFSPFTPSDGMQSAFLAKSYRNSRGKIEGVVVLQISNKFIDSILQSRQGLGETGESYIITYDNQTERFEFRSNMKTMGDNEYTVGYSWSEKELDYWHDAIAAGVGGSSGEYRDSEDKKSLVVYDKMDIPWLNWYLISKIDKEEVLLSLDFVLLSTSIVTLFILIIIVGLSIYFSTKLTDPIIKGAEFAKNISLGNFNSNLDISRRDEIGILAKSLQEMGRSLKEQSWLRLGKTELDDTLRGEHDIVDVGTKFVTFMVKHLDAQIGALYLKDNDCKSLSLSSSYAFSDREGKYKKIAMGEGLVGQAALEKNEIIYTHISKDLPEFNFGVESMIPTCYIATPLLFEDDLIGVFLIGISVPVTTLQRKFISNVKNSISIMLDSAKSRTVIQGLLEDAQIKQEELRVSNEELEMQAEALRSSQKDLQVQQEELRVTNEELQERTIALEKQRHIMEEKNDELEVAGRELENKAKDLEQESKYKSEFLANMSHELRTPLNSILILSKLISNNKKGNLDQKQIKSAEAINSSGEDLLKLINEILDSSKVEAGKIEIVLENMVLASLTKDLERVFIPTAEQKGIHLSIIKDETLPISVVTDPHRLQQILKNLLTNAFKFTEKSGSVTLKMIHEADNIVFAVTDTGIGIPLEKQASVFEAFQQVDGSTSRKYGGTGLGLSISKELTKLLGGTIKLESEVGKGSTFSVTLPMKKDIITNKNSNKEVVKKVDLFVKDDRNIVSSENKTLLIIEDDVNYATILKEQAHNRGFKVLVAEDGESGLHFADYYRPSCIILDIGLPGIDGYGVMERLKNDPELKHIPVHFMSGHQEQLQAMKMGAIGFMAKPARREDVTDAFQKIEKAISSRLRKLLIIEDDKLQRESLEEFIGGEDLSIKGVGTGKEAIELMKSTDYDCVILDLGLEDMSGYDLLDKIKSDPEISQTPIIVYTGKDLSSEEELRLNKFTESIIIKGIKSPERLLEESSLFLHRVTSELPDIKKEIVGYDNKRDNVLVGKNILLVDDDMRNIFALSNILEEKDINVIVARDGIESLEKIKENPDIDLVLMDIMMPKMDGYEAINKIRIFKDRDDLPIIALTANAMKGDRNKCIEAGANDYLAKPVDNSKLVSMLRVWLY